MIQEGNELADAVVLARCIYYVYVIKMTKMDDD